MCPSEEDLYKIWFTQLHGIGPVTEHKLLTVTNEIKRLFDATYEELVHEYGIRASIAELITAQQDLSLARYILEDCHKQSVGILSWTDANYPQELLRLSEIPLVMYYRGNLRGNLMGEGIIGARRCTREGKQKAIEKATELAKADITIISGMAKGVDSYAQTAAIKNHGYTIAVLGNGPDICYPVENRPLMECIVENGLVLSQYPPGTKATRYTFPLRNRIIAALSRTLYVFDVGRFSGTHSTIEACRRYGHNVESL